MPTSRCRVLPYLDKAAALRTAAGPASAPGLCLGRLAPGARRAAYGKASWIQTGS